MTSKNPMSCRQLKLIQNCEIKMVSLFSLFIFSKIFSLFSSKKKMDEKMLMVFVPSLSKSSDSAIFALSIAVFKTEKIFFASFPFFFHLSLSLFENHKQASKQATRLGVVDDDDGARGRNNNIPSFLLSKRSFSAFIF